jgi:hypothetical protein
MLALAAGGGGETELLVEQPPRASANNPAARPQPRALTARARL